MSDTALVPQIQDIATTFKTIPSQPMLLNSPFAYVGMFGADGATQPDQIVFGAIGITTNGIEIYGNADAAGRNAYNYEAVSFDTCGGHPNPANQVMIRPCGEGGREGGREGNKPHPPVVGLIRTPSTQHHNSFSYSTTTIASLLRGASKASPTLPSSTLPSLPSWLTVSRCSGS